jgi:hypothetical protein
VTLALLLLTLSACLPNPDAPPPSGKINEGINLLLTQFTKSHSALVNWNSEVVKAQLHEKFPQGVATEAGWRIVWPHAPAGGLPQVVIPWEFLAQYPNHPQLNINNYSGGNAVPQSVATAIRAAELPNQAGDPYFAAIVHLRSSTVDPRWVIFTSVPYLPVTDIAYGFAENDHGKWKVIDFGTAQVGCGAVPTQVLSEFGFTCS